MSDLTEPVATTTIDAADVNVIAASAPPHKTDNEEEEGAALVSGSAAVEMKSGLSSGEDASESSTSNEVDGSKAAKEKNAAEDEDDDDDDDDDEESASRRGMQRMDSMFSPQILECNGSIFPVTQDPILHEPPADLKTFFSAPPRLGKYVELIKSLLRPPQPPASASASPPSGSPKTSEPPAVAAAAAAAASSAADATKHLDRELVMQLCQDVTSVFSSEPSLLDIPIGIDETLVVVGDVHGQFHDMTHHVLNQQYEKPANSPDRKFLFLGDYVDRGPQGVETIMLLFALKVEYPQSIFILRGNHEESQTSRIYGFMFEVRTKFNDISVWARFNEVFCFIPLAAIVSTPEHRMFAVHGGLSPSLTDVNVIRDISRVDYGGSLDTTESDIVDGLLWSDPSDGVVRFSRNERGCGYLFGGAAANEFCEQNQLDFICRAHQMTMQGYSWTHNSKVLTVFSAPNYCGVSNNLAAILIINHLWELNFVQYQMAPNRQAITPPTVAFGGWSFFQ